MSRVVRILSLSEGERSLLAAFVAVALFGAGLAFVVVTRLNGIDILLHPISLYDCWLIVSGAAGGILGLRLSLPYLGQAGPRGVVLAAVSVPYSVVIGAVVAGTFALPGFGTMFGPFAALMAFLDNPLLFAFWTVSIGAAHVLIMVWRRERDSLFALPPDDGIPA